MKSRAPRVAVALLAGGLLAGACLAYVASHAAVERLDPMTTRSEPASTDDGASLSIDRAIARDGSPLAAPPRSRPVSSPILADDFDAIDGPAAITRSLERLAAMPPGDPAIALGRRLELSITPKNARAFVDALLGVDHPAVERAAHAALALAVDSEVLTELVGRYDATPQPRRGRILELLEDMESPAATRSLIETVARDTAEKRSPLLVSAMRGLARIGTAESVGYLIGQVATDNEAYALMALEHVRTEQAREMIRAASVGNKDSAGLAPEILATLARIAAAKAP